MVSKICYLLLLMHVMAGKHTPKGLLCRICESFQAQVSVMITAKRHVAVHIGTAICKVGLASDFCKYFVGTFVDDIFINKADYVMQTNYICSEMFNFCDKNSMPYDFTKFKDDFNAKYPPRGVKKKSRGIGFKMLVLNDIHIQNDYAYKANTDCGEIGGCCSNSHAPPKKKENEAGYWGTIDKNCDIPPRTFDSTVKYIKENLDKPDFLVVLGDNYGHNYFRTSEKELVDTNKYVYDTLKSNFPDTIILPVLGNHECHPVDHLDFKDPDNFVYKYLYPIFEEFIGAEQLERLKKNGYYALTYPKYNVKVIQINTQMKDAFNGDLMADNTNPLSFFDHIGEEFYQSELIGEKIIILTHIPIGSISDIDDFDTNLKVVIERFSHVIMGTLSGHTHKDSFVFVKNEYNDIVAVNHVSPSLTTLGSLNPSFRVYAFEDEFMQDYLQYVLDLNRHNQLAEQGNFTLIYNLNYRFKDAYQLNSWGGAKDYKELHDKVFYEEYFTRLFSYNHVPSVTAIDDHKIQPSALCDNFDSARKNFSCRQRTGDIYLALLVRRLFRYIFVEPWRTPVANII